MVTSPQNDTFGNQSNVSGISLQSSCRYCQGTSGRVLDFVILDGSIRNIIQNTASAVCALIDPVWAVIEEGLEAAVFPAGYHSILLQGVKEKEEEEEAYPGPWDYPGEREWHRPVGRNH